MTSLVALDPLARDNAGEGAVLRAAGAVVRVELPGVCGPGQWRGMRRPGRC